MKFTKMHGCGNDYIYVYDPIQSVKEPEKLAIAMSDRHFGIGADGLVIILPSETGDFRMRMFNADGSEAEMCGNASRCVGKYVYEKKLTPKTEIILETKAGTKMLSLHTYKGKVERVTVDMGTPVFTPEQIPVRLSGESVLQQEVEIADKKEWITCVSMGNPHTIIFTECMKDIDVHKRGSQIESDPLFPERCNVEFIEVISPELLNMRVWERGSGETLACGTGACAAVVAGVMAGRCERTCTVKLPGGDLEINWNKTNNHVYLTGEATMVFEGEWK